MTPRRIVVGVDGSPGGRRALRWALDHAARTGATLQVVTVFAYEGSQRPRALPGARAVRRRREAEAHQRRDLAAAFEQAPARPAVLESLVVPGNATAATLAEMALDADLLVLGSHGHGAWESRLLGTVSTECVRQAPCPVVIVPARDRRSPDAAVVPASTAAFTAAFTAAGPHVG